RLVYGYEYGYAYGARRERSDGGGPPQEFLNRRRKARPPRPTSMTMTAARPAVDSSGAGAVGTVQTPGLPARSQRPGRGHTMSQQTPPEQTSPGSQASGCSSHEPPGPISCTH